MCAETEHRCMIKCVRHHPCMAFNYHAINKTCVLLPEVECIPPSPDNGSGYVYVFVHLTACKFQSVYTSVRPADRNWYWSISDNPIDNTDVILLPGTTTRYVGTMLYRDYSLPGWWRPDGQGFRAIDPVTTQAVTCPHGALLAFPNSSLYRWNPYVPGDPQPNCALTVYQHPDGTPLYVTRHQIIQEGGGDDADRTEQILGFYNHEKKSAYFVLNGVIYPPTVYIICW